MGTKKKIFGLALILSLACISFFGLKNIIASKAEEPDVSARLIYASDLAYGNPTSNTKYSFDKENDEYSPYAIYVTSSVASGSAITLSQNTFNDEIDFTTIKIWNNNCEVMVEADYIDKASLILTGDESWLDVGWSHYQRGECEANKYTGEENATAIADYFNNFYIYDPEKENYFNDEFVYMGFVDENKVDNPVGDPHFGKSVIEIDWEMNVTNLELGSNVVAFIKDGGILRVDGSIKLGEGAYIDAVDSNPRLEINNGDFNTDDMQLYDYSEESGCTPLTSDKAGLYYHTEQDIDGTSTWVWVRNNNNIPSDAIGSPDVTAAAKKYIYAYANLDFDSDGYKTGEDIKFALAEELLVKFRGSYGMFGLYGDYGGERDEIWDKAFTDAIEFSKRINIDFTEYDIIYAKNAKNENEPITRYTATVNWGYAEDHSLISDTVYVYILNQPEQILICTDFDDDKGEGKSYYIRFAFGDKQKLVGNEEGSWDDVDEDYIANVIIGSFSNVVAGGHGVTQYTKNVDTDLYTFQTVSYSYMKHYEENEWRVLDFDTFVKIFNTSKLYFATASEGEPCKYDFVSHDATNNAADKIWEAGGQYPVKLFIHDNILHIMPLNGNSGVGKALKDVRLLDQIPAAAITINNENTEDIVITFNSNFYDTVNFELIYADGDTGTFTVEREGIIIQYTGLNDNNLIDEIRDQGHNWLDLYGENNGNDLYYSYDCEAENFVVMATYYHSSSEQGKDNLSLIVTYDDGSTEIISSVDEEHEFSGYRSGADYNAVDTTTFIIGFMKADGTDFTFKKGDHEGGFSVQVVNAGYNDSKSFGGALAGSGKGKYWDGNAHTSY